MFKLIDPKTFPGQVQLRTKAGETIALDVVWRHFGDHALRARLNGLSDAAALAELIGSWSGVGDRDGVPVPPTEISIASLLDELDDNPVKAFFEAYGKARGDAAQGN